MTKNDKTWVVQTYIDKLPPEEIVEKILQNRGLDKKQRELFLTPQKPQEIALEEIGIDTTQLKILVKRLKEAREKGESIIIYGDYDVDGVCATAIMWELLYKNDFNATPYIPERFSEGYGINFNSIDKLKKKDEKISLVITVDNGISAQTEIEKIKNIGIDVIVTDHHEKSEKKLKDALAVIHTTQICGSAIAYFVAEYLSKKFTKSTKFDRLELAALGTVADQLTLINVNRNIVFHGIKNLQKSKRPGIKALLKDSKIGGSIGVYELNYIIAPRINAAGRIEHAIEGLRLLCTSDEKKSYEIEKKLSKLNEERQLLLEKLTEKAVKNLTEIGKIIIIEGDYHEGVIGLVASRVVEKYYRPTIVISTKEEVAKASARSIPGFSIIEAIKSQNELLISGGGHKMAAGFSIDIKSLPKFKKEITKYANAKLTDDLLVKKIVIDCQTPIINLTKQLVNRLEEFEPTGIGNSKPVFSSTNLNVVSIKKMGKEENHIKIVLAQENSKITAVGFNMANYDIQKGDCIDIAYNVIINEWNGQSSVELKLKDIKKV